MERKPPLPFSPQFLVHDFGLASTSHPRDPPTHFLPVLGAGKEEQERVLESSGGGAGTRLEAAEGCCTAPALGRERTEPGAREQEAAALEPATSTQLGHHHEYKHGINPF